MRFPNARDKRCRSRPFGLVRVHDANREKLGRLRVAGIGADAVAVAPADRRKPPPAVQVVTVSVIDLTADRSLEHGPINGARQSGGTAHRS
jgi:hypothetical protein